MKDQLDFLSRKNIPAAKLDSTMDREEYNYVLKKARDGSLKILMISVERFKNERFRIQLKGMQISLLVVDEAHCISEWGHNFRPEYLKIPFYKEKFGIDRILLVEKLSIALDGPGCFSRFKGVLEGYPEERERWFEFDEKRRRERFEEWLEYEEIEIIE